MTLGGLRIADTLDLPREAVTQTFGILAKRGVGKTYTALVLVEEMLTAGLQVVVADPVGVCWGLRAAADGENPGLPIVILGGDHADVPLQVDAGEVIADLVVDERLSVVLDLSLFRKGQQTRFMQDFCERLYHRNREPLHLVLDEADAFAPQRPMKGQERMLGAVEDLVRRGRARGIGVTLVTQRAAVLNKDVLTQVEVLVALRTIAPQDREAIDAWIRVHGTPQQREELMVSLPSLPVGTAWLWSPGWLGIFERVQVRQRRTFDSSATPKVGDRSVGPRILAPVDLQRLEARIQATIERAKAEDPKRLRARIAELERELGAARAARPTPERVVERVEVPVEVPVEIPVLPADVREALQHDLERFHEAALEISQFLYKAVEGIGTLYQSLARWEQPSNVKPPTGLPLAKPAVPTHPRPALAAPPPPAAPASAEPPPLDEPLELKTGERRLLQTLASRYPLKLTRSQLAILARYTASGGAFSGAFGRLKRYGLLVENTAGEVEITQAGLDHFGGELPPVPQTRAEVQEMWRSALRPGEARLLDALIAVYPEALSREELAARTEFTASGGAFSGYLGTLRRNGLAVVQGNCVRAGDTLFLMT